MSWVLILVVYHGGVAVSTVGFEGRAACEAAKAWVARDVSRYARAECFPITSEEKTR